MLLSSECENNFIWALKKLRGLFLRGDVPRCTHGLPCACELARYQLGVIPLKEAHVMWTRLSFSDMSSSDSSLKFSIQQEFDVILNNFKQVDIASKVTIKSKLREVVYPNMTSMCSPVDKVKTKGSQKGRTNRLARPTSVTLSYFDHVDKIHFMHDSCSSLNAQRDMHLPQFHIKSNVIPMLV